MAFNSNGQVSYLVLDSLSKGSKYGLEIIEYISQKTGGNYILKKPTLYSCLTRMEKKGLISSSYWGESELGGKRHYYTITNEGSRELEQLAAEFESENDEYKNENLIENAVSVANDISQIKDSNSFLENDKNVEEKPVFLQQDNLFDLVKPAAKIEETEEDESDVVDNQIDIFNYQESLKNEENISKVVPAEELSQSTDDEEKIKYYEKILEQSPVKDDGKLLDDSEKLTPSQEAQNRMLYDTSSELKKYRKRKSFSENQIEMAMTYDDKQDPEIQKERIEQLKQAMLNSRQNAVATKQEDISAQRAVQTPAVQIDDSTNIEKQQDDAVYITHRIDAAEMPIQKKISPANIEVNIYDDNLPAPKRNSNLEPTYKDMMAKLFERKKEKVVQPKAEPTPSVVEEKQIQSFSDYESLKKYYSSHNIDFKEYRKTTVTRRHNTNLLNLISSAIMLLLSGVGCAILFGILNAAHLARSETNFIFYSIPAMFLIYVVLNAIKYKVAESKKAFLNYNAITNWAIAILATVIIFIINVTCGMLFETMSDFSTTLIVPIYAILLIFPVDYYIRKFLYSKYGK